MTEIKRENCMNPWKTIEAIEYEGHMGDPLVKQLSFLAECFHYSISSYTPEEILLAGCATGNGIEGTEKFTVKRLVAMDINEEFLEITRERYGNLPFLEVVEGSVLNPLPGTFDLIQAGLILEYVEIGTALRNFYEALNPNGVLAVVIQLQSPHVNSITPTKYSSLNRLKPIMKHCTIKTVKEDAEKVGFTCEYDDVRTLDSQKQFGIIHFRK